MLAITLPCLIFFLYWKHLPESPRWLLMQGKHDEARRTLEQAARINGINEVKFEFDKDSTEAKGKPSLVREFKMLVSSWYLLRSTLIIWCCWMTLSGAYYGLSLNTKNMGGDIYLNYLIISLVEIPAKQPWLYSIEDDL